jgi:hypothetical protein
MLLPVSVWKVASALSASVVMAAALVVAAMAVAFSAVDTRATSSQVLAANFPRHLRVIRLRVCNHVGHSRQCLRLLAVLSTFYFARSQLTSG